MSNPFVEAIARQVSCAAGIGEEKLINLIEIPPNLEMGDYSVPCFGLAKIFKKSPNQIARELSEVIETGDRILEVRPVGPYLNFLVNWSDFVRKTISEILTKRKDYGCSKEGVGKIVVIDFSSPNISKPFTIAHIRTTVIGHSLSRLYSALGWKVVGINHLGDWGAPHGMNIAAYKRWGDREAVKKNPPHELFNLYVRFNAELEDDPSLKEEARMWTQKLESEDSEAIQLWKWFREETLKDFDRVYRWMEVSFTEVIGESFFRDKVEPVVNKLKEKGLAVESEGALVVLLDDYNMPPCILQTGHGTSVYHSRDLAAAIYRKEKFNFDRMIYTTDAGQSLHFRQVFKVLELMGYKWAKNCAHVPFGVISFKKARMSTRRGNVIFLEDVLKRAVELVQKIIEEKNPELSDKGGVARDVGIGAVVYADLNSRRTRDVVFDWDEVLNFNGETGPYIQYTHARYRSVLRKYGREVSISDLDFSLITEREAIALVRCLELFPSQIQKAVHNDEPSFVAKYLIELCSVANQFYNSHRVISDDLALTRIRIALVHCITVVLAQGLFLLGMKAPEEM